MLRKNAQQELLNNKEGEGQVPVTNLHTELNTVYLRGNKDHLLRSNLNLKNNWELRNLPSYFSQILLLEIFYYYFIGFQSPKFGNQELCIPNYALSFLSRNFHGSTNCQSLILGKKATLVPSNEV